MELVWLVPVAGFAGVAFALWLAWDVLRRDTGTDAMREVASMIFEGAMAFLKRQYQTIAIMAVVTGVLIAIIVGAVSEGVKDISLNNAGQIGYGAKVVDHWKEGLLTGIAFLVGAAASALAGYIGMYISVRSNARCASAATRSLKEAITVSLRGGAVSGFLVTSLSLLGVSGIFLTYSRLLGNPPTIAPFLIVGFGFGASFVALFAQLGGGIYTKAADVGADLVGKVEAGIPEDDPRNPATIADNVGDNVGDVAGMGADLYESYAGSILATAALGASAFLGRGDLQLKAVVAPMVIAAIGTLLSIFGIFMVRTKEGATQKQLLGSLGRGINTSSILIVVFSLGVIKVLDLPLGIWGSVVCGLVSGIVIGRATEYFTSSSYRPTMRIADNAKTGPATVIIAGLGTGMMSTAIPVLSVVVGTLLAYLFAAHFNMSNVGQGLYGIGIAAVGMLSTLGITLATDAYGPIADNAGGNAQMTGQGKEVRQRTDALDSLGNTTAATGKGFAIGSAALTALALLASYVEEIKVGLVRIGHTTLQFADGLSLETAKAQFLDLMRYYNVTLMNPLVLVGIFLGSMMAFSFCGLAITAVGKAAGRMVDEVRRQFKEIAGIMEGKAEPDYARCVEISTRGAQRAMVFPSLLAIIVPFATGVFLGIPGVMGLLIGGTSTGFVLAIFMANTGGAWDNAKKYIEEGHFGGKGSPAHHAAVIGDTVGDPFKDTAGPSLNILIKLMSMVAIVMAGLTVAFSLFKR